MVLETGSRGGARNAAINFPKDYAGKWVILFSHRADFTPVCTTEFMTFAPMMPEFKALSGELIGLSIGSHYTHIAWLRTVIEPGIWAGIVATFAHLPPSLRRRVHAAAAFSSVVAATPRL